MVHVLSSPAITSQFDEQFDLLGPIWQDDCNHKPEEYIGSFEVPNYRVKKDDWEAEQRFDVYVYTCRVYGQAVCMRHSNDEGDYWSCGSVCDLIVRAAKLDSVAYKMAASLICRKMTPTWTKNK